MKKNILITLTICIFLISFARAQEAVKSGEVLFFKPDKILLHTGDIVDIKKNTVIRVNDKEVLSYAPKPGQLAYVKINPRTLKAQSVDIYDSSQKEKTRADGLYINNFEVKDKKPLKQNQYLNVVLRGSPGKEASFSVFGAAREMKLKEISPGTYTGSFRIYEGLDIADAAVMGKLRDNNNTVRAIVSGITIASTKPAILDVSPKIGSISDVTDPNIFAHYVSRAALINVSACAMYINGKEVSSEKNMNLITHKSEGLPYGKNRVSVRITDSAGNTTWKSWEFYIGVKP